MKSMLPKWLTAMAATSLLLVSGTGYADDRDADRDETHAYKLIQLAKATPDECYGGIGASYEAYNSGCSLGRLPKVNQSYVWGLAKTNTDLWLGTAANVNCLVEGGYLGSTSAYETASWACEFGQSGYRAAFAPSLPAIIGDWRPSQILRKPLSSGSLVNAGATMDVTGKTRLAQTLGLRSAGTHRNVVFLAGPALNQQAINLFAFDAKTKLFVGSYVLPGYKNIRKWIVAGNELYTTVGRVNGTGALIKWTGTLAAPFSFTEVGSLPSEGAELTEHKGRLYVATWPNLDPAHPAWAGVFYTATLPSRGGLPNSVAALSQLWDVRNYEPDPVVALSYGGGAIASFQGKLVWGTMHVPGAAPGIHLRKYAAYYDSLSGPERTVRQFLSLLGTYRALAIFSHDAGQTQLLYGQALLPAFNPNTLSWGVVPNAAGLVPVHGLSGFNSPFNNYTWTMATTEHSLFVGTMDWGYLLRAQIQGILPAGLVPPTPEAFQALKAQVLAIPALQTWLTDHPELLNAIGEMVTNPGPVYPTNLASALASGADLMRFDSLDQKAVAVSRDGLGNYLNYGFRTMISADDTLYIGTANPMNLETLTNDARPEGGWELLKLKIED